MLLVSQKKDKNLTLTELFALEDAEAFKASAVYLRRLSDGGSSIPQIYLYDNTRSTFSENDLAHIHRDLWSNSRIPIFLVIEESEVKIFDTREPVQVEGETGEIIRNTILDTVPFATEAIKQYSKRLFDTGIFWESEKAKGHFLESKSAYQDLINGLKKIRIKFTENLHQDDAIERKVFDKLLVFSILLKYLEERGGLFAEGFFKKIGSKNYCDALRKGKVFTLFSELSKHFNGRIFEWTEIEKEIILLNANLNDLAGFLDADVDSVTGQGFFWRRYSFNHLPVELISSVYETFLSENEDAVYTPEFLVNALLDKVMAPNDYEVTALKTIDGSCGSGIFLVGVFKRLAQRYRYSCFLETGILKPAEPEILLKIIKDNIFGVDIEDESVRLTVFSLCLALCDELTPKQIWTELKFNETFQTNFQSQNFFEYLEENESTLGTWDLVIGNPPFNGLTVRKDKKGEYFGSFSGKQANKNRRTIRLNDEVVQNYKQQVYPDNQIALMFLDQAPRTLKKGGVVCLILPSGPLLYNNSSTFRKHFFPKYQVSEILDFTSLDSILFGKANVPTAALVAVKQPHEEYKPIKHITIRRTKTVEEKLLFEVDKYDFHLVSQYDGIYDKHVWKSNLLGGGRLNKVVDRLSNLRSIEDFINANNWAYGAGYQIGPINKQDKVAPYITGRPTLPTAALTENGVDENQINFETAEKFHRISDEKLFTPPHLLIKRNIGGNKIPTYFTDKYLTFKKIIFGIAVAEDERDRLFELSKAFDINKGIYNLFIAATSNEYLVGRATTLHNQDILNLPYPDDKKELNLSFAEQIVCDDVLDYYSEIKARASSAKLNRPTKHEGTRNFWRCVYEGP